MSILKVNPESYSEVHSEDSIQNNWAAVYAKSEIYNHRDTAVLDHPDGSVTKAKLADEVNAIISKAEKDADTAVSTANTAVNTASAATATANTATAKRKANKAPKDFDMLKAIRAEKDYKSNIKRRDINSRKFIDENYDIKGKPAILPGQLIMFNYLEPATKEQLEYYDAMPCTIFFGIVKMEICQEHLMLYR